jgi:hypothetical protein
VTSTADHAAARATYEAVGSRLTLTMKPTVLRNLRRASAAWTTLSRAM